MCSLVCTPLPFVVSQLSSWFITQDISNPRPLPFVSQLSDKLVHHTRHCQSQAPPFCFTTVKLVHHTRHFQSQAPPFCFTTVKLVHHTRHCQSQAPPFCFATVRQASSSHKTFPIPGPSLLCVLLYRQCFLVSSTHLKK